jgi:hypothetical protein
MPKGDLSLSDLKEIVLANATGISNINNMMKENATTMRENISNVASLMLELGIYSSGRCSLDNG